MSDVTKPDHAPAPKMELRPDGSMASSVDREAFASRQASVAWANEPEETPDQQREARIQKFQEAIGEKKRDVFDGEPVREKSKGELSKEHDAAINKGGIER